MSRRRFIAGAVCPKCAEMDRLILEGRGEDRQRVCVACGYRDTLPSAASREPTNRLDAARRMDTAASEAQPLKILDRSGPSEES